MKRVIIIAEAGVNHNGDYQRAVDMVYAAKEAGADYVKFQTAVPELVISSVAPKAEYQKETTGNNESQLEMCRKIHLKLDDYLPLSELCREVGIGFIKAAEKERKICLTRQYSRWLCQIMLSTANR